MAMEIFATLGITLVGILISALVLMLTAMIFKLKDKSYLTALKVAGIVGLVGWLFDVIITANLATSPGALGGIVLVRFVLVTILLGLYMLRNFYSLDWKNAFLVWLVWLVLGFVIGLILGFILAAIGIGAIAAAAA